MNKSQVGVHERGSGLKDVSPVEDWDLRWEAEKMPKRLPRIGVEMELIPDFLHCALGLAEKHPQAVAQCQGCGLSTQSVTRGVGSDPPRFLFAKPLRS